MYGAMTTKRKSTPQATTYPRKFGALYPGPASGSLTMQWGAFLGTTTIPSAEEQVRLCFSEIGLRLLRARETLVDELEAAFDRRMQPLDKRMPHSESERLRFALALNAVGKFLQEARVPLELVAFLSSLGSDLLDYSAGLQPKVLDPPPVQNRRGDGSRDWQARAGLALAVEVLVRGGLSRRTAAQYVAARSTIMDSLMSKNAATASSALEGWHKGLSNRKVTSRAAISVFEGRDEAIDHAASWIGSRDPQRLAAYLIAFAETLWAPGQKPPLNFPSDPS